ncbi:DNA-binding transcriptional regulator, MocR family, contains an aminotransferase domain [Pseudomonas flavescens]|uniref:DNA-binding transcriptional regulator, MocR family, contains an aminotransferase domain n=1 Tax=Phytopseudomonas flavescens TaxID=29435 RepID=A0A1G8GNS6_9GAMM|nr:PLP-dependent aminotransferase family protein [Pseudomonas flavescens]SDH95967.1 DNA-binding transcriptional regulator, MocR family, contains an aminotransferase domain [Pseudomonas flavescens]
MSIRPGDGEQPASSLIDQVCQALIERIHGGELSLGARLPSLRKYAAERGVSVDTVLRAYDKLVGLGYLESRRGSGFYVKRSKPQRQQKTDWGGINSLGEPWSALLTREVAQSESPGDGSLLQAWMDEGALGDALRGMRKLTSEDFANHISPRGHAPLRQTLQRNLARVGIHAQTSQIVTTNGATDAFHLAVWANFFPRDYVIVEAPGHFLHVQRLLASGLEILRVPRLADGPDLEVLRGLCEKHSPRAFVCSSLLQNPTSSSLSPYKAHQIVKIAEEFDLLLIDDDTYGDLLPSSALGHVARLGALDQLQRVIHIGSFSKTLSPGLRSGYLAASAQQVERILLYKSVGAIHGPVLTEWAVHQLLATPAYHAHCERLKARLDEAREPLVQRLRALGCRLKNPGAGMYLWAELGGDRDADGIARALAAKGLQMAPGSLFCRFPPFASHLRFNVSTTQARHLELLARCLDDRAAGS